MKKIRLVQIIGILLFLAYSILLVFDVLKGFLVNYSRFVFSILMAIIGLNLIFKGVVLKSNSTLWFANVLLSLAITIIVFSLLKIDMQKYCYVFSIVPILASILNLFVFNNKIYVKIIIVNITIIIPTIIQYFYKFELYWFVCITIVSVLLGIFLCRFINFDKENV